MRLLALLLMGSSLAAPLHAAYLLIPPDAQEIMNVLGGDGNGLHLHADALPDLFTLTARRLEEDPKIFVVEEPYVSGHWKGGKAVIEYARDLSYTQVSVFDKYGRRQRIYAVRSKLEEAKAKDEKRHQEALILQAKNAFTGPPTNLDDEDDRPRRRHPVAEPVTPQVAEYEEAASEPEQKTRPAEPVARVAPVKTVEAPPPPPAKSPISVASDIDETTVEAGPHFEWDEARGAYVPVSVKVLAAATPTAAPKVAVTAAPPPPPPAESSAKKGSRASRKKAVPAENIQPIDLHPSPESTGDWQALNAELDKRNKSVDVPPYHEPGTPAKATSVPAETNDTYSNAEVPAAPAPTPAKVATKKTKGKRKAGADVQAAPEQVVLPSSDAYDLPADEKKSARGAAAAPVVNDPALAAATESLAKQQKQAAAAAAVKIPGVTDTADQGKQKLDSDGWTPSNAKATPEAEIAFQEKKKAAPVDSSIDGLMKLASINEGAVPNEAANWVPKATSLPTPDADIHEELTRAHTDRKSVVAPVVRINRDINNPEEGVLPVNSFEKSSGSRYGRHREYERRIFFAKKNGAGVPPKSYDFYVDETDRKKEFHNIYYYTHENKGKPPRLVAVEKHSHVTFLSNYDVDKEDKGKVSTY